MSLQFLFPTWLWALSLIAIPIIIHLFNFRRYKVVYFTNVHLLKEAKKDNHSKTKLKEWLILLSRILLIAFLVIAFAQPVFVDLEKQKYYSQQSDLIIVIDNSFSMSAEGQAGILLENAKNKALEIISAYPASTKVMLLSTDLLAQQLIYKTKEESYAAVGQVKISAYSESINQVLKVVQNRLNQDFLHHIYVISDYQKNNYQPIDVQDSSSRYFLVPLETVKNKNIFVDTAYFVSPIHNVFEDEQLIYTLTNTGEDEVVDFNVELYINDSLKTISNVDIPSGQTISDTFNYRNSSFGMKKGRISISDFPIVFDNNLFFNYFIKKNLKVGVYSDLPSNTYLNAFFKNNTYYQVTNFDTENVDLESWKLSDLIILNTNSTITSGVQENIKQHLELGKSLIIFVNESDKNQIFWQSLHLEFSNADTSKKQIERFNHNSDIYKNTFTKLSDEIYLPEVDYSIPLYKYKEWLVKTKTEAVLVALQKYEKANILVISIPMLPENNSFYTHPIFIPLMYNFISDAQSYSLYYQSNIENSMFVQNNSDAEDKILHIQTDNDSWIPEQYVVNSGVKIHLPAKQEAGYYSVTDNAQELSGFSYNYNRKESFPNFYSLEELYEWNTIVLNESKINSFSIKESISHSKNLWYYSILLTILFLLLEILLIKFWRN